MDRSISLDDPYFFEKINNNRSDLFNQEKIQKNIEHERLINEFIDRWYLSEDGDSEGLKQSSKAEMRRQMEAIINPVDSK